MSNLWRVCLLILIFFPPTGALGEVETAVESIEEPTTVLYCGRLAFDVIIGASVATCVDSVLNQYLMLTASTGLAVGFHFNAFILVYESSDGSDIAGTYYGGKGTVAFGLYGAAVGLFFKHRPKDPLSIGEDAGGPFDDRLYWIGYAAGATVDVAALMVKIYRLDGDRLDSE